MIPVLIEEAAVSLGGVALAGVAGKFAKDVLWEHCLKDLVFGTVTDELKSQILHRTVKLSSRVFHFEKHPSLVFLSHYLGNEDVEAAGAAIVSAGVAEAAVKHFKLGSLHLTTWKEPAAAKPEPAMHSNRTLLPFLDRNQGNGNQPLDIYA